MSPLFVKIFSSLYFTFLFLFQTSFSHAQTIFNNESSLSDSQSSIKMSDVIEFQIISFAEKKNKSIEIKLKTKNDFKIYEDKLKFTYRPKHSLAYSLNYITSSVSEEYFDSFYQEKKRTYRNNSVFSVVSHLNIEPGDAIQIDVQTCSSQVCLMPGVLYLNVILNSKSYEKEKDYLYTNKKENIKTILHSSIDKPNINSENNESNSIFQKITSFNEIISLKLEEAIKEKNIILFPILFLAGLLMNLTPCVYPMIPITLNVIAQFAPVKSNNSNKNDVNRRRILPFVYVFGMILSYSALGVFAGMSGNVFGAQLAKPIFNWIIAVIMILLGLSMLGIFNLSRIQNFAHKIPLSSRYPYLGVGTMGAVSGLIAAPCTGPVLSTILVLIAQNKNPISGFTYMLFFALGFGLPYVFLGFLEEFYLLPRFPKIMQFIKVFFASLMFALAVYYLKNIFTNTFFAELIFEKPNFLTVLIFLLFTLIFTLFSSHKNLRGKISNYGLLICCFMLSIWLTFGVTNSFRKNMNTKMSTISTDISSRIFWETDLNKAIELSKSTKKPIFVDIWAEWCSACLEMDETTWQDKNIIKHLNKNYIALKLDFTDSPEYLQLIINRWKINGLPAIAFLKSDSNFQNIPDILFQGTSSTEKILNTIVQFQTDQQR